MDEYRKQELILENELKDEEDSFWIFTMLVESILPLDYYSNMVGALVDQKVFYDIFKKRIPELSTHL